MRNSLLLTCALAALLGGAAYAQTGETKAGNSAAVQTQPSAEAPSSAPAKRQQGGQERTQERSQERSNVQGQSGQRDQAGQSSEQSERTNRNDQSNQGANRDEERRGEHSTRNFDRDQDRTYEGRNYRERNDRESYEDRDRERYGGRFDDRRRYGNEEYDNDRRSYQGRRYGYQYDRGYRTSRRFTVTRRERQRIFNILTRRRYEPVRVDFPLRIGVRIPSYVTLYDVPEDVYDFAPGYEGYEYFVTDDDEIIIVDPDTMEIVAVLDD